MKIVHLIPSVDYGGTERLMLTLAAQQQAIGYEVHVISFTDNNGYEALSRGLSMVHLPPVEVVWKWNTTVSKNLGALEKTLSELRPDIIHSHSYWNDLMLYSLPKCPGARYFSHFHLFYPFYKRLPVFDPSFFGHEFVRRRMFRAYSAYGTSFIAVSKAIQEYYKAEFPQANGERITVIPNAIDLSQFSRAGGTAVKTNQILSVGRLTPEKNPMFLLLVAEQLKSKGLEFIWKIAGEGFLRDELTRTISSLKLEGSVFLVGHVEDIGQVFRESRVFVHASVQEPFGLVFLEAMATGVPSVSLRAGGNEEIVTNWVEGILLPSHSSAKEFAEAIAEMLTNDTQYEELRKNGLERVKQFSFNTYAKSIMDCYSSPQG